MTDSNEARSPSSPPTRSTAQQVTYWVILVSLVVAVSITGGWWLAASVRFTASTGFLFALATIALWMAVYRLLILGIKRMVRSRIAQSGVERA